jgi:RimJ/RimL family protein N-acetyltransferase
VVEPRYPIETERLSLRPLVYEDFDDAHAYYSRPDVARYLYWQARDREESLEVLARYAGLTELEEEGDGLVLGVVPREVGRVVGQVNLQWRSREHRQGEIGFVFHPDHHGRGYAGEAAREMLRIGFEDLLLHRISGRCDARNLASARLMERLGMRREAHLVENELIKGEWTDELVYAMLEQEWFAGRRPD